MHQQIPENQRSSRIETRLRATDPARAGYVALPFRSTLVARERQSYHKSYHIEHSRGPLACTSPTVILLRLHHT